MDIGLWVVLLILVIVVVVALSRAVRIVPQAVAMVIERLGKYQATLGPGFHLLIPFLDKVRAGVDMREQVVSFPPQPVITSDNLVVEIDTVIYFQVTDARSAVYEIANYITAIEQLTVTTLRNVIGAMDLEQTLTSRDQINGQLRGVLDEATGRWGIRVNRVELKSIDPPASVQGAMEQQMRAERDRRAAILTAEGVKQSQILRAEGEKQSAILTAEGAAQAKILEAEGESRAIMQVFEAIHRGNADPKLLSYQYIQMLPELAKGTANTNWVIPTEFTAALGSIAKGFGGGTTAPGDDGGSPPPVVPTTDFLTGGSALPSPGEALAEAQRQAEAATADATSSGSRSGAPFDPSVERGQNPAGGAAGRPSAQAQPRPVDGDEGDVPPPPAPPQL